MQDILSLILGGGRGVRLYPLTKNRSEPAVPIAGKYRLIDIPISNCINSEIRRIYVMTQFLSASLHRHIANTFKFDPFSDAFVEVLAAQQTNETASWFQGTADAIRQHLSYIESDSARDVLILSGDQLYRMNFAELVQTHRERQADVTVAVAPVTRDRAPHLGVVQLNEQDCIVRMVEKPQDEKTLQELALTSAWQQRHGFPEDDRRYLANMGIYLFSRDILIELLRQSPLAHDLVCEVLARRLSSRPIQAHVFQGYWADVGTIRSYFEASLALASDAPPFDFHSSEGVVYTRMRNLPASRVEDAVAQQCLISDGCHVGPGARLERCVVGVRSRIGANAVLRDTVLIGADNYETEDDRLHNRQKGIPDIGIGDHTYIERAIIDKDARIGCNVRIVNQSGVQEADGDHFVIRDGIVIIPDRAIVPDGTVI